MFIQPDDSFYLNHIVELSSKIENLIDSTAAGEEVEWKKAHDLVRYLFSNIRSDCEIIRKYLQNGITQVDNIKLSDRVHLFGQYTQNLEFLYMILHLHEPKANVSISLL